MFHSDQQKKTTEGQTKVMFKSRGCREGPVPLWKQTSWCRRTSASQASYSRTTTLPPWRTAGHRRESQTRKRYLHRLQRRWSYAWRWGGQNGSVMINKLLFFILSPVWVKHCNFTNFQCSFIFGSFNGQQFHRNKEDTKMRKHTLSDHGSIHRHRNLNETERSVIARNRNFNAPIICKIAVLQIGNPPYAVNRPRIYDCCLSAILWV